jgi:hypothetical protein
MERPFGLLVRFNTNFTSRHYNYFYNETRTTPCSQLPRQLLALAQCLLLRLILIVEISPLIVELRGLVREHLVQGFSFFFNSALASVASESNTSFSVPCSGNVFSFLGNTLILFLAISCSWKTLIEPLPSNGRLCFIPTSILLLLGIVYRALLSNGL